MVGRRCQGKCEYLTLSGTTAVMKVNGGEVLLCSDRSHGGGTERSLRRQGNALRTETPRVSIDEKTSEKPRDGEYYTGSSFSERWRKQEGREKIIK